MMWLLSLLYAACLTLSLAMPKHYKQIFSGRTLSSNSKVLLRSLGWLLLLLALVFAVQVWGAGYGLVLLLGALTALLFVLVLLLSYWPRGALTLALLLPMLSAITQ